MSRSTLLQRSVRASLALVAVLSVAGCGWLNSYFVGSDNTAPPAELKAIAEAAPVQTLWSRSLTSGDGGAFIDLRPALVGDRLFVPGHKGDVVAVDTTTGNVVWQTDVDASISAGAGTGERLVLVGTIDGEVIALNQSDGSETWRARVPSEVLATPGAAEGVVVVRTVDGNFTGLDASSGERLWGHSASEPALTLRGTAPPVVQQGVVLSGLDNGKLLLLRLADGTNLGEKTVAPPSGRTEIDRIHDIDAELRVDGNKVYIVAYQDTISALDLESGNTLWSRELSSHAGLDIDQQDVYVTTDTSEVVSLSRSGGGTMWRQDELTARRLSAPVAAGGHIVVGDLEGYLHWLDRESGRIRARSKLSGGRISATPVLRDGVLYVLSEVGRVSAVSATPDG